MPFKRPLCLICGLFALLVLLRVLVFPLPRGDYDDLEKRTVILKGRVMSKQVKTYRTGTAYLELSLHSLSDLSVLSETDDTSFSPVTAYHPKGVLVKLPISQEEPKMGALLTVKGKVRSFSRATNPGEFDEETYRLTEDLDFSLEEGEILKQTAPRFLLRESMYRWRLAFGVILERAFPKEEAGVLKAMLLGDKSDLSEDTKKLYQASGILHILAISGLHISILGLLFYELLKRLYVPSFLAAPICLWFIYLFSLIIGGGISPVRAILMFSLKLLADVLGRTYDMLTAVTLTLALMLAGHPYYVLHAGFLLSFGAVLGISLLAPFLEEILPGKRKSRIRRLLVGPLSILLTTFPVLLTFYYTFSPYAILLNLLVIPLMNVVLVDGILVLVIGVFTLGRGLFLPALPDHLLLTLYEKASRIFLYLPGSVQICGKPEMIRVFAYYAGLILVLFLFRKNRLPRMGVYQVLLFLMILVSMKIRLPGMQVSAVDVGQGLCILVENENGESILFDAGSTSKSKTGTYQILPFLKSRGISYLSAVILSHPDEDHINAMEEVLADGQNGGVVIGRILLPYGKDAVMEGYADIVGHAKEQKIPVYLASAGECMEFGTLSAYCLGPEKGDNPGDINEISQSWLLTGRHSLLLTGDITGRGEEEMGKRLKEKMKELSLDHIDILQVAHHGSAYSTPETFIQIARPVYALISCGANNSYGHPHEELLKRLEAFGVEIHVTAREGALMYNPVKQRVTGYLQTVF